jgi:hypothetical protein
MSVYARITKGDAVVNEMLVTDIGTVMDWLTRHKGEYDGYEIKYRKASEIRQGREP